MLFKDEVVLAKLGKVLSHTRNKNFVFAFAQTPWATITLKMPFTVIFGRHGPRFAYTPPLKVLKFFIKI